MKRRMVNQSNDFNASLSKRNSTKYKKHRGKQSLNLSLKDALDIYTSTFRKEEFNVVDQYVKLPKVTALNFRTISKNVSNTVS